MTLLYIAASTLSTGDMLQDLQWMPETTDITKSYTYCGFSYTHTPFHLKEALYGFCLVCLNCQHHYS